MQKLGMRQAMALELDAPHSGRFRRRRESAVPRPGRGGRNPYRRQEEESPNRTWTLWVRSWGVKDRAAEGATVHTDESAAYRGLPFERGAVNHSAGEYVSGAASTATFGSSRATVTYRDLTRP